MAALTGHADPWEFSALLRFLAEGQRRGAKPPVMVCNLLQTDIGPWWAPLMYKTWADQCDACAGRTHADLHVHEISECWKEIYIMIYPVQRTSCFLKIWLEKQIVEAMIMLTLVKGSLLKLLPLYSWQNVSSSLIILAKMLLFKRLSPKLQSTSLKWRFSHSRIWWRKRKEYFIITSYYT